MTMLASQTDRRRASGRDAAFLMAIIAGGVAKAAGSGLLACPYRVSSGLGAFWRHGWRRGKAPGGNISRETLCETGRGRETRPGRGGSIMGPRRKWRDWDLLELDECLDEGMSRRLIAQVLERSYASVRTMVSKRQKALARDAAA